MLNAFIAVQTHILFACGFECVFLALFTLAIKFQIVKKKKALIKIELGVAVLLFAEAVAYTYQGDSSETGFFMTRAANLLVYLATIGNVYFLNEYVTVLFMSTGKFKTLPKRLLLGFILPSVGATFVVISNFTGWYYYFDEYNVYHRGPLFWMGYLFPVIGLSLLVWFVIEKRELVGRGIWCSILLCAILPVLAAVTQGFVYGVSFINFSVWGATTLTFWFALLDQNTELAKAANTERDTGLPNTYGYLYEADQIINHHDITQYCAYYFDIVRMNQYNNKYGNETGNEIIYRYAKAIRKQIEKDEILGRLGGNFFVALIKKTNTDRFLKLLSDVPVTFLFEGNEETVHVAAVAGVYEIKNKNIAAGKLIGFCANALSYAKNVQHKPYVFHDDVLEKELARIQKVEENTRKALKNKEFEPFYQPKMDIRQNCVCGAEALVRWKKDGEYISPAEFVPVMERNGSVCDLDFLILSRVCQDLRDWLDAGIEPVTVSVNFSRKNFGIPNLAEEVWKIVSSYQIPEHLVQIEITETSDEYPLSCLVKVVKELQSHGLSVAIDDFGTGSSSVGVLKETPFDVLKIDKSFIDYKDEKGKKILQEIIHLAGEIGLELVAEGVETTKQAEELKQMGCYIIQGFVFDKPLEKRVYETRLKQADGRQVCEETKEAAASL